MITGSITIEDPVAIARGILDGSIQPNRGCAILAALCDKNGFPESLLRFSFLAHEQTGHENFGFTAENAVPEILEACRKLVGAP